MDPDLKKLLAAAIAKYDQMTPAERARHDYLQRRSFVRGMCPTSQSYEEWCEAVDRILPPI